MSDVTVTLERIVCRNTTEAGHDEVYYLSPAIIRRRGAATTTDAPLAAGPTAAQGANAGGPGGDNTAWDCNDSPPLSDQRLNVPLFAVPVSAGERVFVTLSFMESDGENLADVEAKAAAVATGVLGVITAVAPPAVAVTIPIGAGIAAASAAFQVAKSFLTNEDDPLGSVTLMLDADGPNVRLRQVGVASGSLSEISANGASGRLTARLLGSGADYDVTLVLDGATTQKASGLTVEPPLTQELSSGQFVHWENANPQGATGTLLGTAVTLTGPMGTAFALHDEYPNFNRPTFTPQLPATGMVEIAGGPGHTFTLSFARPVQDPVILLGSLASRMTFSNGATVSKISGDAGLHAAGDTVTGEVAAGEPGGPTDSNGTVRLNGLFSQLAFSLAPNFGDGTANDGVFFQLGGTLPA